MSSFRPKAILEQAKLNEKNGNLKEAVLQYSLLIEYLLKNSRYSDALKLVHKSLTLHATYTRLFLQKARAYVGLQDMQKAEKAISDLVPLCIQSKKIEKYGQMVSQQFEEVPALRRLFFEKWLALDRTSSHPFVRLAEICAETNQIARAKELLVQALQVSGSQELALTLLREILEKHGDTKAVEHLNRFENKEMPLEKFISLLHNQPRTFEEVSRPFIQTERKLNSMIFDLMEEVGLEVKNDVDQVKPLLSEFRRRADPILAEDDESRIDLGLAFFEMGFFEAAEEEWNHISSTSAFYVKAQTLLARALCAQGSDVAALEALQICLRSPQIKTETAIEVLYAMLEIYIRLGDYDQCCKLASLLNKKAPNYRQLKMKLKEIEQLAPAKKKAS